MNYIISSSSPNFYYITKKKIDGCYLVRINKKDYILTSKMNKEFVKNQVKLPIINDNQLNKLIKNKRIGIEFNNIGNLKITKNNFFDIKPYFYKKRVKKSEKEINYIKKATKITKKLLDFNPFEFETEKEVYHYLLSKTYELGLEPAFAPIVAADKNTKYPHYIAKNKKIKNAVLIDYGVKYKEYCSDITRMYFKKEKCKHKQLYEKAKSLFYIIMEHFKNFKSSKDIAIFSSDLFKKNKLNEFHSIGHGIGLEVHEYPRLNKKYKDFIKTTMAIEPGIYLKDYGVRYENTIVFDGKKIKIL